MADWITSLVDRMGYLGIAALMLLENLFPPIPSELIMPWAGYAASRGALSLVGVILAGTAGSVAGAFVWYLIGRRLGAERLKGWAARHGRWITLRPRDVDRIDAWFERHCGPAVLFGRLVPAVRTLISIPAGIFEMAPGRFLLFSTLGTLIWSGALALAGNALGQRYDVVNSYLGPVSTAIIVAVLASYLYRVATFGRG